MKEVVEFRPDQNLIDNDFPGYKLSLESIPIYEKDLESSVDVLQPSDEQYVYAQVKIFCFHNYLHFNISTPELCYFINENWHIVQVSIGFMNRIEKIISVCEIPKNRNRCAGDYPLDIKFLGIDRAVITDGIGTFHIAAIKKDKWIIIFTDNLPINSILTSALQDEKNVHILSLEPKFDSILTLRSFDENWQVKTEKKVQVSGDLKLATIEASKFLTIITNGQKAPKFLNSSEIQAEVETGPKYKWTQTADDVTILIGVKGTETNEINVTTSEQNLAVSVKGVDIVHGDFAHAVFDVVWRVKDEELVISAMKVEKNLGWNLVIDGDFSGQQIQTVDAEEKDDHVFNNDELEDVDVSSPAVLLRLNLDEGQITHQSDLSTLQFLHTVYVEPKKQPAICLRHLTDACVWQLQTNEDIWQQKHIGTFSAFGYVQASKRHRKFIVAPPNLSYVIIADVYSYLYIFRQPSPVNGTLRNRTFGTRTSAIAKQQLINLGDCDKIIGIQASNTLLFVLTKKKFYTLVINETTL